MITGQNLEPWVDLMKESLEAIDGTRGNPDMATLRDQFAMAALQPIVTSMIASEATADEKVLARSAYILADAMMEARKR